MNSQQVKAAFAAAGIKVRVADQGLKFRVCRLGEVAHDVQASNAVCASLGLTDCFGKLGGVLLQPHEMACYKPGAIRNC